jgi:hypothetical protein
MVGKKYVLVEAYINGLNEPMVWSISDATDMEVLKWLASKELTPDTYLNKWKLFVDNRLITSKTELKEHFSYELPKKLGNWYLA